MIKKTTKEKLYFPEVKEKEADVTKAPKRKKQKSRARVKASSKKEPIIHQFTTASTVPRASRKVAETVAYQEIQSQVAEARATIRDVRRKVAKKEMSFEEAKGAIKHVLKLINVLAEKSKALEEEESKNK